MDPANRLVGGSNCIAVKLKVIKRLEIIWMRNWMFAFPDTINWSIPARQSLRIDFFEGLGDTWVWMCFSQG